MKERPILFSGPMVRAILDGSKTQTRRPVVAPWMQFVQFTGGKGDAQNDPRHWGFEDDEGEWWALEGHAVEGSQTLPCRIAQEGDRLWVRETWTPGYEHDPDDGSVEVIYKADGSSQCRLAPDGVAEEWDRRYSDDGPEDPIWRPSIHMPKWAARIWLDVVSVRVERLQAISEADALAEGISGAKVRTGPLALAGRPLASEYAHLWDETYGTWASNPWVWVVTFKRSEGQP